MTEPRISLNDPRAVNSPRKAALSARVEELLAEDVELATRKLLAKQEIAPVKTSPVKIVWNEKLHPRNEAGLFSKKPKSIGKIFEPISKKTSIKTKTTAFGDNGFKDILVGLALGAIDEVMDVPSTLPKLNLFQTDFEKPGLRGLYSKRTNEVSIDTDLGTQDRAFTAIHEIGHFLDYNTIFGISRTDVAPNRNEVDPHKNTGLWDSITNSDVFKRIKDVGDKNPDPDVKDAVAYLLTPTELFARAFSQYIVQKASNAELKRELKARQEEEGTQWEANDFAAISREFDKILQPKPKPKAKPAPKKKKK